MEPIKDSAVVFSEKSEFVVENGAIKRKAKAKKAKPAAAKPAKKKPRIRNGTNEDYCLKCKDCTPNANRSYRVTANNRHIRSSTCVTCGAIKTSFVTAGTVEENL